MSFCNKLFSCVSLFVMLSAFPASAGMEVYRSKSGYDPVVMPARDGVALVIDNDEIPPIEPTIAPVKFLRIETTGSTHEKVDRLIWGVKKDIRPEHDHYGYEIRRYMANIGNTKIYENREFLVEQIKNVRKARIIAKFWADLIEEDIAYVDQKMIEENIAQSDFTLKTAFKQNKLTARKFTISLKAWIDTNEKLLMFIYEQPNLYTVRYPRVNVIVTQARMDLYNLITLRQSRLKDMRAYKAFEMMVY